MVWRRMMNRVTPKLQAINTFGRSLNRMRQDPVESIGKKVKFDLATVSFQVNYELPEEGYRPPPVDSVHPNKSNFYLLMLQQITYVQWIKIFISFICLIKFLLQTYDVYQFYQKGLAQSSVSYELPQVIELPSVTLCMPVIIPFNPKCLDNSTHDPSVCAELPLSMLFNQSLSEFGHQCKLKSGGSTQNCANIAHPIETFYQSKRCYTYLAEIAHFRTNFEDTQASISEYRQNHITLYIQKNHFSRQSSVAELYLHQVDQIPVDLLKEPLLLEPGGHYSLEYYYFKFLRMDSEFFECRNYSGQYDEDSSESSLRQYISRQQCFDRCVSNTFGAHCAHCHSQSLPIRRDLVSPSDRLCLDPTRECTESTVEHVLTLCNSRCPNDCASIDVAYDLTRSNAEDPSETVVTISRKITPDRVMSQWAMLSGQAAASEIGGLCAFWLLVAWLAFRLIDGALYAWDLIQLYYL